MDDKAIKELEADLWEMADLLRAEAYSAVEKAARKDKETVQAGYDEKIVEAEEVLAISQKMEDMGS